MVEIQMTAYAMLAHALLAHKDRRYVKANMAFGIDILNGSQTLADLG